MTAQTETQLLDKWFGKLLTQMPQELRERVERHIPDWDTRSGAEQRAAAAAIDRERAANVRVVTDALSNVFHKPLHKLPLALRMNIKKYVPLWPDLSASERRRAAMEIDMQRATKRRMQWDRMGGTPSAEETAEYERAWKTDEWLAPGTEQAPRATGAAPGENNPPATTAILVVKANGATLSPAERRAQKDITRERGARRRILENWADIESLHGQGADAHQVLRFLKRDKDAKQPTLKTVQNTMSALRGEGLIP